MNQGNISLTRLVIPAIALIGLGIGFGLGLRGLLLWTKHKILSVPGPSKRKVKIRKKEEGSVHIISSVGDWEKVYTLLKHDTDTIKVVGLDCEWVFEDYVRHPVALVQISTQQGLCLLVRLCHMQGQIPRSLKMFLADRRILKVGVAVKEDGKKLYQDYGLSVSGCVDLRLLLGYIPNLYNCKTRGLQGLAEGILGVTMEKDADIRCGNWEAEELTSEQIQYAAADAMVAVDIFTKMILTKHCGQDPTFLFPPGSCCVDVNVFSSLASSLCSDLIDQIYHSRRNTRTGGTVDASNKQLKKVDIDERGTRAFSPRQRPLDFRCQLQLPNGKMLRRCDILRAEWYLEKNLGRKVSADPFIVQLKYEPEETQVDEDFDDLYEEHGDAQGVCVVCGRSDYFIRKYVIPTEYRRYFKRVMKSCRRSHNIVIMCPSCYQLSSQYDSILRQQLAVQCNAPLDSGGGSKTVKDRELQKIKAAAKALCLNRDKIPQQRLHELEKLVMEFHRVTSLTSDLLKQTMNMDVLVENSSYVPHGKKVVDYYRERSRLYDFEKMWRKHFLETMQPNHMPPFWLVDFRNVNAHVQVLESHTST